MDYFDYREWVTWQAEDVAAYANEIAGEHRLSSRQSRYLRDQMLQQSGHWPESPRVHRLGPFKMTARMEETFRELAGDAADIWAENHRLNRPFVPPKIKAPQISGRSIGSGLTRRFKRETVERDRFWQSEKRKQRKRFAKEPFVTLRHQIMQRGDDAFWRSNCYPIEPGLWLNMWANEKPYECPLWYAGQIERHYENARKQAELGNFEGAMWHAFTCGARLAELDLRLAHGPMFEKYEAVYSAQRDSGRSSMKVPEEVRRETYWRYRNAGHKRTEAGRLAAQELNVTEATIRNAFSDKCYPADKSV